MSVRKSRAVARAGVVSLTVAAGLAITALPAFASAEQEGIDPGSKLGLGLALLIFIGIPLAVFSFIAMLVFGPSLMRRPRYRPGYQDWGFRPVWVGGPDDPDAALTATPTDVVIDVRGGGAGASW